MRKQVILMKLITGDMVIGWRTSQGGTSNFVKYPHYVEDGMIGNSWFPGIQKDRDTGRDENRYEFPFNRNFGVAGEDRIEPDLVREFMSLNSLTEEDRYE